MRRRYPSFLLAFSILAVSVRLSAKDPNYITFDVPGSSNTAPHSINPSGIITGKYLASIGLSVTVHGFTRATDGTFTTFDPPAPYTDISPLRINSAASITGNYVGAGFTFHGFLRTNDGAFTTFDVRGAGTGSGLGTQPESINSAGVITGTYADAASRWHGFVRATDGTFVKFDAPGAGTGVNQGTFARDINPTGAVTGHYKDASGAWHGFLRASDGTFITFDAPCAGSGADLGTVPTMINPAGVIAGHYFSDSCGVDEFYDFNDVRAPRGFLRWPDGTFVTFVSPYESPESINPAGVIVGVYVDANYRVRGFVRGHNGLFSGLDVPGSTATYVKSINPGQVITGSYEDANHVQHGFLLTLHSLEQNANLENVTRDLTARPRMIR